MSVSLSDEQMGVQVIKLLHVRLVLTSIAEVHSDPSRSGLILLSCRQELKSKFLEAPIIVPLYQQWQWAIVCTHVYQLVG